MTGTTGKQTCQTINEARKTKLVSKAAFTHTLPLSQRNTFFAQKPFCTHTILHRDALTHKPFYTKTFTHKSFYTQTLLHRFTFTHKHFYTNIFTQKHSYTQTRLHTKTFTHRSLYTHTLLHSCHFYRNTFYTETSSALTPSLHRDALNTQTLLHTDTFTHKSFYTQIAAFTQIHLLHTNTFTHKPSLHRNTLNTQTRLHTKTFTHRSFYKHTRTFTQMLTFTSTNRDLTLKHLYTDQHSFRAKPVAPGQVNSQFYTQKLLTIDTLTFVRKGCSGTSKLAILPQFFDDQHSFRAKGLLRDK